ncbi:hypothetical protein ACHAW6_002846 [Cyclotella cf. meneghiniana]
MYMAHSFMIHTALHSSKYGSDDISIWPLPTKVDHHDLMLAHVWGCPVYDFEPKLQDNQRQSKLNCHACIGQFLGFSCEHSSMVAMVRNLHTGFVSPQHHVVVDDNFQTFFNDGKTLEDFDKICRRLFVENCECYMEDKYADDGMRIYTPPTLDKVWFSESECYK